MKLCFQPLFDQFLVSFGLREVYIAPRGTPNVVEGLKKPQKWTALVAYVILDTKIFIQLQKLRKLWINRKIAFLGGTKNACLGNDVSQPFKEWRENPESETSEWEKIFFSSTNFFNFFSVARYGPVLAKNRNYPIPEPHLRIVQVFRSKNVH